MMEERLRIGIKSECYRCYRLTFLMKICFFIYFKLKSPERGFNEFKKKKKLKSLGEWGIIFSFSSLEWVPLIIAKNDSLGFNIQLLKKG